MSSPPHEIAPQRARSSPLAGSLLSAVRLLTIVPVPAAAPRERDRGRQANRVEAAPETGAGELHPRTGGGAIAAEAGEGELGRSAAWFPLVGALLGGAAGGIRLLCQPLGPLPASALALAVMTALTGALHQDGLADTADGLGARGGRQRRLAAMRDHAVGAFGVLALLWWGILMLTTVASLHGLRAFDVLLVAGAVSRLAAVLHAALTRPARSDGLGAAFDVSVHQAAAASVLAAAIAVATVGPTAGGVALASSLLVALTASSLAKRALGGRTGDTLGATVALSEVAACVALLAIG